MAASDTRSSFDLNTMCPVSSTHLDAADYAVKSFTEEMEGRDLRLEQTVRGRNFLWDGKTAVADIKNLSLTGYQVIKYTLDESKYDGGAKNINSIPLILSLIHI